MRGKDLDMKTVKLTLWLVLLYVIQTVFVNLIKISGIAPELMLVFAVVYSFHERSFVSASYTAIICGMLAGSLMSNNFPLSVIITGIFGMIAFYAKNTLKFVPGAVRCIAVTASASFILGAAHCFTAFKEISMYSFVTEIIPYTIYTAAAVILIYPFIRLSFFKEKDEKKLLLL